MATRTSIIGLHKPAYNDNADISVINQDMDMIDAALGKAEGISAPIYDPTATYVVDSYCTYNMDMYRCTTAITTPEDWNASHWTKTTIVGEFGNIKPSGGGVFRDITVTIDPEDWTFNSTTNQYEYTWVNAYVTQTAGISVAYRDRTVRRYLVSDVDFEKVNGGVEFMTDNIPTDTIRFTVRIIDASIDGVFPISAELISTSAVTGVDNVEDALAIVGDACSYRSITIATSDWSVTSPYTYEYEWNKITADCSVEIIPESGAENSGIEDFDITVLSGKVRITTIYEPVGSFPVTIKVLNAVTRRVQQITGADVATDVITGSSNVNEALNSLSSNLVTSEIPITDFCSINTGTINSQYSKVCKNNKTVFFHIDISANADLSTITISAGYRPPFSTNVIVADNKTGNMIGLLFIRNTGICSYYGTSNTNAKIVDGMYLIE